MPIPSRVLLAFDDSPFAEAAVYDLPRAGLPDDTHLTILSVVELWLPPPPSYALIDTQFAPALGGPMAIAKDRTARAADLVRTMCPSWTVEARARTGSPATEILDEAEEHGTSLIIAGSHGRTGLVRVLLGSVSQKLIAGAACSVRIGRGRIEESTSPLRLIVGVDGSLGSADAVRAIAERNWPKGTVVRLVTALGPFAPSTDDVEAAMAHVREFQSNAEEVLRAAELDISSAIREADPKHLLVEQAETWGADCIFVGAVGSARRLRMFGSCATAVAARAACSVEVVRPAT